MTAPDDRWTSSPWCAMNGSQNHADFTDLTPTQRAVVELLSRDASIHRLSPPAAAGVTTASAEVLRNDPVLDSLGRDARTMAERGGLMERVFDASVAYLPRRHVAAPAPIHSHARHAQQIRPRSLRLDLRGWGALAAGMILTFVLGTRLLQQPQPVASAFVLHEIIAIGDPTDDDDALEFGVASLTPVDLGEITFDDIERELNLIESLLAMR